jgi:hypothetical protein
MGDESPFSVLGCVSPNTGLVAQLTSESIPE